MSNADRWVARSDRWLLRFSAWQTMLLFAGGFMLAQPALVWVFTRVNASQFPIATREQWMNFLLFVAAVGAVAGALWHLAFRIQRRYLR